MFFGEFQHSLDEKGRLTLPADFRGELAAGAVISQFPGPCLAVYPTTAWETTVVEQIDEQFREGRIGAHTRRALFASARRMQPDGQGRVVVPPELRTYAGLGRDATVIGHAARVEIWARERWLDSKASGDAQLAEALEALSL